MRQGTGPLDQATLGRLRGLMLIVALLLPTLTAAEPRHGLMWNRSGLPAVFPLQVKSLPGKNYVVTLFEKETGKAALAAYFKGGQYFRVLVPPGSYTLRFEYGQTWNNESERFGPDTDSGVFELPEPLIFETRGIGTKAGHIVDLRKSLGDTFAGAIIRDQFTCQRARLEPVGTWRPSADPLRHRIPVMRIRSEAGAPMAGPTRSPLLHLRWSVESHLCPLPPQTR